MLRKTLVVLGAVGVLIHTGCDDSAHAPSGPEPPSIDRNQTPSGSPIVSPSYSVFLTLREDAPPVGWANEIRGLGGYNEGVSRISPMVWSDFRKYPPVVALEHIPWVEKVSVSLNDVRPTVDYQSWGYQYIGAYDAYSRGVRGSGVKAGVMDTGINCSHDDFASIIAGGYQFYENNDQYCNPIDAHGTNVAGVLAADDDGDGALGVAPDVSLYDLHVFHLEWDAQLGRVVPVASYSDIRQALEWAGFEGLDVVNMSLGACGGYDQDVANALAFARHAGVVLVAAGGNGDFSPGCSSNDPVSFPASDPNTIAVSAVDQDLGYASGYQYGPEIDVAAPHDVRTSDYSGSGITADGLRGTSFATPHVAGTAALLKGLGLATDDVEYRILSTATDAGAPGHDDYYGFGILNTRKAVVADVEIAGPTVINNEGTYQWTAETTGGGSAQGFQWAVKYVNVGYWQNLGTSSSQSLQVSYSTGDFYMKVTFNSAGMSDVDQIFVKNYIECTDRKC